MDDHILLQYHKKELINATMDTATSKYHHYNFLYYFFNFSYVSLYSPILSNIFQRYIIVMQDIKT